ncbi:MAG: class I SAM-dependent rRNA methyltransferase [Pirellulales bacterium]
MSIQRELPISIQSGPEPVGVPRIVIKPGKVRPFFGRHPWVLDSAVARIDGFVADGAEVDVVSHKGSWIARGLFNSRSRICTRLYSWQPGEALDTDFWHKRLTAAIELRKQLGYDQSEGAARLVYSEADGLSGLVVDRYADYLVVQVNALVMAERLDTIVPLLAELAAPRGILARAEGGTAKLEGLEFEMGLRWGVAPDGPVFITENGVRYGVDLGEGQKTGYYLDQRENRVAAAKYLHGCRVLDMFCYSGSFSLAALLHGGARETLGFDGSERAIALARAGAELNHAHAAHFEVADAFEALDELAAKGEKFGAVILDPPKFTRSRKNLNAALRAYHRINRMAVALLEPGGILVTCSCSGAVTSEDFLLMLAGVAQQTRRDIQVLEQRGASPDHPVSTTCLETEYLKCFICRVL